MAQKDFDYVSSISNYPQAESENKSINSLLVYTMNISPIISMKNHQDASL